MSDPNRPHPGTIGWHDLTVPDAEKARDFYAAVVGWTPEPVDMGGYSDFNMKAGSGEAVAGVCHAKGPNADIPPQWMMYVVVDDLERSLKECERRGGSIVAGPKGEGDRFCVIRDPAGAVCALYQPKG